MHKPLFALLLLAGLSTAPLLAVADTTPSPTQPPGSAMPGSHDNAMSMHGSMDSNGAMPGASKALAGTNDQAAPSAAGATMHDGSANAMDMMNACSRMMGDGMMGHGMMRHGMMGHGMMGGMRGPDMSRHGMMGPGMMGPMFRLPPGNEKLQLQMQAEMMQKMGEILAKYASRIDESGQVAR
jgi:hypothetical protein